MPTSFLVAAQFLRPGNGGIAEVARVSTKALAQLGSTQAHACLESHPYTVAGVSVRAYRGSRLRFLLGLMRENLKDTHTLYDFAGTARLAGLLWPHRPYSVWAHGIEIWDDVRPDRARALQNAERVLVNSAHTRTRGDALLRRCRDVRVCPLGSFADEATPITSPTGPPTALLLGRVEDGWPKGQDRLVALWPRVVSAIPHARLRIVGKGPGLAPLQDLARQSPVASQIDIMGFVPEEALEAVWQEASVFAMPSRNEGFGLVFIEAMRRGLPLLSSRTDAGSEVNRDNITGFVLDPDAQDAWVEALVTLLREADLASQLGQQAQDHWRANYRFSAFAARFRAALAL